MIDHEEFARQLIKKRKQQRLKAVIAVVVVGILIIFANVIKINTNSSTSSNTDKKSIVNTSLEYKLASINKGGYVSDNNITITRFRYLLESLDAKTKQSKQRIADMLVTGQRILREQYGRDISLLTLTEGVNNYIPDGSKVDFAIKNTEYIQSWK